MNLKKGFDTLKNQIEYLIDNIKDNKKYLVSLSLSLVAFLILLVVLFFSNGDFSVSKEVNTLVDSISSRRYTEAYQYYENLEKEFSASKMNKFNKSASNKLSSLVAIELKTGSFKTAYLGQLNMYLSVLDDFVRKPNENPSIGIVLCKSADKAYVEYAVRDYEKPMGVATYKTASDMPERLRKALPDIEELKKLL